MATIVVQDSDLIYYLTGCHVEDGFALQTERGAYLLTDMRYYNAVKDNKMVTVLLLSEVPLLKLLNELNANEVGLVMEYSSATLYKELTDNGFKVFDATDDFYLKAKVKTQEELSLLKQSASICERAFLKVLPLIKEGVTELELAGALEYNFKLLGASKPSFETIVAFGEGGAIPHYQTSSVKLTKNTPILMDFGCVYKGYASDMTRVVYYGEPTEEFLKRYNLVLSAHELAYANANAGALACEVDGLVRKYFEKNGVLDLFTHSLGHGVGVKVHEKPRLSKLDSSRLENGNVFSIEPGLYFSGEYGIRIEDTVAVINGKCQTLFTIDKKLITIQ